MGKSKIEQPETIIKYLGSIPVDTGTMILGDPCYVNGDLLKLVCDNALVNKRKGEYISHYEPIIKNDEPTTKKKIPFMGLSFKTGYGDGMYDVYGEFEKHKGAKKGKALIRIIIEMGWDTA